MIILYVEGNTIYIRSKEKSKSFNLLILTICTHLSFELHLRVLHAWFYTHENELHWRVLHA